MGQGLPPEGAPTLAHLGARGEKVFPECSLNGIEVCCTSKANRRCGHNPEPSSGALCPVYASSRGNSGYIASALPWRAGRSTQQTNDVAGPYWVLAPGDRPSHFWWTTARTVYRSPSRQPTSPPAARSTELCQPS